MKNVMGIIYTGEHDEFLRELTLLRAIAAVPVSGRYRMIDFPVSSMVNSGMHNIGVIMQKNYHSLMDHLGSGKEWDLHGKNEGLHILPPFLTRENVGVYNGSLDALHSNMNYLKRSRQEYVLVCNSLILFNTRFNDMFKAYTDSGCDVITLYSKSPDMKRSEYGTYLDVAEDGTVLGIEIDPTRPTYDNTSLEVYLMRKDLLIDLVDRGVAHGYHELVHDVLQRTVRDVGLKVKAIEYTGVCWRLDSVQNYFKMNMDVLDLYVRHQLFVDDCPVYTKIRDEMPTRHGENASVINSLLADGCVIEGTVDHSVLFRGVKIAPGAVVKNCILMQDCQVEEGAYLENVIMDKQACIRRGGKLIGPAAYPIVITKNMTV